MTSVPPIRSPLPLLVTVACLLPAACGDDAAPAPGDAEGTVTVLAATSLTEALADIAAAFEAEHRDVDVALTFDGSSRLAAAIIEGAPADVFASADEPNMSEVVAAGRIEGEPATFASNELQIVVAEGNPLGIHGLEDLSRRDVVLSLCAPEVPCGSYAVLAFERAGLPAPAAGAEENVRGVLSRVQLGEADAGLVYVTDVRGADGVEGIPLAEGEGITATYLAAVVADAPNDAAAVAFRDFLSDPEAQAILGRSGFGPP